MSRRSAFCVCLFALLAGFAGSALYHATTQPAAMAADAAVAPPGEIRATKFVLVDEGGRTMGIIGTFPAVFAAGDKNPPPIKEYRGVVIYGPDGKPNIQLGTGGAVSRLEMKGDVGWMTLGVHPDGSGAGIWVPEDTLRLGIGFQKAGNGGFVINDLAGRQRMGLGMPATAGISMSLTDEAGKPVWSAP